MGSFWNIKNYTHLRKNFTPIKRKKKVMSVSPADFLEIEKKKSQSGRRKPMQTIFFSDGNWEKNKEEEKKNDREIEDKKEEMEERKHDGKNKELEKKTTESQEKKHKKNN